MHFGDIIHHGQPAALEGAHVGDDRPAVLDIDGGLVARHAHDSVGQRHAIDDHVVKVAGIDYVGLGSDFDGVNNLPIGLEDASKLPDLLHELLKRGYTTEDIEKLCSKNIFRVWNEVIAVAEEIADV